MSDWVAEYYEERPRVDGIFADSRVPVRLLNLATGAEIFSSQPDYSPTDYEVVIRHETSRVHRELFGGARPECEAKMREYAEKLGAWEI